MVTTYKKSDSPLGKPAISLIHQNAVGAPKVPLVTIGKQQKII